MEDKSSSKVAQKGDTISVWMKLGYGVGDFSFNLGYQTTAFFLLYFLTDVFAISAAAAGSIFLVSKLWDAVSDPLMGFITDKTKSRWGSKRPYLLFGALPMGAMVFLLFYAPALSNDMKILYGFATFILFCTAITVVNVPYGALTASLSLDAHERSRISAFKMSAALVGTLVAAGATKPIVGLFSNEVEGFRYMGLIYGVIIVIILLITFASVKERVKVKKEENEPFLKNFSVIVKNTPFLVLTINTIIYMIAINVMANMVNYYFKYNLDSEELIPVAFICLFVTAIIFIPIFVFISKYKGKKFGYNIGVIVLAIVLVLMFLFGEHGVTINIIFMIFAGVGISTIFLFPWAMIPDTVEYSEWKTGLRREGILYGVFFFSFKLGAAIAGFISGTTLDLYGYVANVQQTDEVLFGIRFTLTMVPLMALVIGFIILSFYPINNKFHKQILSELDELKVADNNP